MKRFAPAAARNCDPIGEVLARELPADGLVLEVASGSGQHAAAFAARFPALRWQPTDVAPDALESIAAWRDGAGADNLLAPLKLDATASDWPVARADAMLAVNLLHISPWRTCEGLLSGAGRTLGTGAPLLIYGPFHLSDRPTTASNQRFDASLRAQDPAWGLRHLDEVAATAEQSGLALVRIWDMPANNITAAFRRV